MVLPRPTSSAMNRFARGSSSAFLSGVELVVHELDARAERAWNSRASVAVTAFHRSACK